jgi:hypothetical protein
MKITAIDSKNDLFYIQNIITEELLKKLSQEILEAIPYTKMEWQENIPRKRLAQMPGSTLSQIHEHINTQKESIGKAIGQTVKQIDTAFWLDQEGFDFNAHIDNPGVEKVMQIYLSDCENAGTVFYNVEDSEIEIKDDDQRWHYKGQCPPTNIRKEFDFKLNTGYLMINDQRQLHGVPNKIGKDDIRLSVYCWIN